MEREIDYLKLEQQTRLLVEYVNQNPDLFYDSNLDMVVVPYEINLLAKNYAEQLDRSLVGQYSQFLDAQDPQRIASIPSGKEFYALPEDLNGMTPKKASELFDRATSSVAEGLSEIRAFAANHARMRTFNSELFFEDSKDIDKSIYSDFYCPKIEHCMLTTIQYDFEAIESALEKAIPKRKSEIELFAEAHSDIEILEGEYEEKEFKEPSVDISDKAEAFLIRQGENLIKRIEEGDRTSFWTNPIFTLQAKNPITNYVYNIENMSVLNDAVSAFSYRTALFMSFDDAVKKGFTIPKGTGSHEIIQRFGKKVKEVTQIVDGKEVPLLDANGEPQYYWKRCIRTANVFNIDQLEWKHKDKPDPREQWIAEYKRPAKIQLSNEKELNIFDQVLSKAIIADGIRIVDGGKGCFFSPARNTISLTTLFRNNLVAIGVKAHEYAHSTGVKEKLNRECLYKYHTSEAFRGMEELVANCSARKLVMHYGLDANEVVNQYHKSEDAYDLSWALPVFKKNPSLIMKSMIMGELSFQYMKERIDTQLKADNVYGMFIDETKQYKKPAPIAENKSEGVKNNKSYKNRRTV